MMMMNPPKPEGMGFQTQVLHLTEEVSCFVEVASKGKKTSFLSMTNLRLKPAHVNSFDFLSCSWLGPRAGARWWALCGRRVEVVGFEERVRGG